MSGTLLVDDVLTLAEAVYLQLRSCRDLPSDIHDILALSLPHSDHAPSFSPFSSALPPTLTTAANQQSSDSHVTQSLYSVTPSGAGEVVRTTTCGGDATPTNDIDDGSIEILSESV